jgi:hypothetical protein
MVDGLDSFDTFLKIYKKVLNEYAGQFRIDNIYDRKFILALMDSIRNALLSCLNSLLEAACGNAYKVVVPLRQDDILLKNCYSFLIKNTGFMYKLIFGGLYPFYLQDFLDFYTEIITFFSEFTKWTIKLDEYYNYKKGFRVWREIDNFVENVIAVDISFSECEGSIKISIIKV